MMGDPLSRELEFRLDAREWLLNSHDTSVFDGATAPRGGESPGEIRIGLVEAGTRRMVAERLAANARLDGLAWMDAALDAGISQSEIARLLGVSRQAVSQHVQQRAADRAQPRADSGAA